MLQKETILRKLERIMMAVTFAEANLRIWLLVFLKQDKRGIREENKERVKTKRDRDELRL